MFLCRSGTSAISQASKPKTIRTLSDDSFKDILKKSEKVLLKTRKKNYIHLQSGNKFDFRILRKKMKYTHQDKCQSDSKPSYKLEKVE